MYKLKTKHPKHACQHCGCESKIVETIIEDEFSRDEVEQEYIPVGFTNNFAHTGTETCADCGKEWTGF